METKIILDSNVLIDFIRGKEIAILLIKKLSENHEMCTTDINIFELFYGAYLSKNNEKNIAAIKGIINTMIVFNTDIKSMEIAGKTLAILEKKGQITEIRDVLISGICLTNNCPIVTFNKSDFERLGVKIIQ